MNDTETFESVKTRLDEIVEAVSQEDVSLDDALALYEEAVGLGLKACDLSETDLLLDEEENPQEGAQDIQPAQSESTANAEASM